MIPTWHDPEVRDLLARWEILKKAWRFQWDAEVGQAWHRPSEVDQWSAYVEPLAAYGLDPRTLVVSEHDPVLAELRARAGQWTMHDAAQAFMAGLWSAPAAWRSALPGVVLARAMPDHDLDPWSEAESELCQICGFRGHGIDAQVVGEWAFRLTIGTPLDGEPTGYARTFRWFDDRRPTPTEYDRWALGAIRAVLRTLPPATRYSKAGKAIDAAGLLSGKQGAEVLDDMALVGVLASPEHPGMLERFTTYREREVRPNRRVEVQAPLGFWSTSVGDAGVRTELWEEVFPDVPEVDLARPRPTPTPPKKDTLTGGLGARTRALAPKAERASASIGDGPAAAGDVWAMRVRPGKWVTFYVHDVNTERDRPYARVELLRGVFPEQPTAGEVSTQSQPSTRGRSIMYAHSVEKTPWTRRIAQGVAAPEGEGDVPSKGSWQALLHLKQMAESANRGL